MSVARTSMIKSFRKEDWSSFENFEDMLNSYYAIKRQEAETWCISSTPLSNFVLCNHYILWQDQNGLQFKMGCFNL